MTPRTPPEALPLVVENIPEDLRDSEYWVSWRWELRNGKWTKVLVDAATGGRANSTDPSTWGTLEDAVRCARERRLPGVGFVFTGSPFAGVDLDNCLNPETGEVEPWAMGIVEGLASYTEFSPSGTGLHVIVRAELPRGGRRRKGRIEMYDSGRFFTVTGHRLSDAQTRVIERTEQLASLHRRVFGVLTTPERPTARPPDPPGGGTILDDDELVRRAGSAANGEKFRRLWAGDAGEYADGDNEGRSEADLALCSLLAFWCGPDADRIDRLFRQSGLYRPKWERDDYRARTIGAALALRRGEFWSGPKPASRSKARRVRKGAVRV